MTKPEIHEMFASFCELMYFTLNDRFKEFLREWWRDQVDSARANQVSGLGLSEEEQGVLDQEAVYMQARAAIAEFYIANRYAIDSATTTVDINAAADAGLTDASSLAMNLAGGDPDIEAKFNDEIAHMSRAISGEQEVGLDG